MQGSEREKRRIQSLIQQSEAKRQQIQEGISAVPKGPGRDRLTCELIEGRLAVSRAQMTAEASISDQIIEDQQVGSNEC